MDAPSTDKPTSVSRPFVLLILATFVAIVGFVVWFVASQVGAHEPGKRVSRNLAQTIDLNLELRKGMAMQLRLLERYLETVDPALQQTFAELNFELSESQIHYLALDIDNEERLVVERIKSLHSQIGLAAFQVFEHARSEDRETVKRRMRRIEDLRPQIDAELERLNVLQAHRLRLLLETSGGGPGPTAILLGVSTLLLTLVVFLVLLRRRVLAPLQELLVAESRIQERDFSARAKIERNDEIGQVARKFNFMAQSLEQLYAELEQRVERRTSELRELQKQLIQSEKMSAVGRLVSGVAHELNNPLTAVMGFAELTRESMARSGMDSTETRRLDVIVEQCNRCRKIVENLIQFSRMEEIPLGPVRLVEVVEAAVRLRQYEMTTRAVHVRTSFSGAPVVKADPFKIQQVVLTLLNNAVDAIRENGGAGEIHVQVSATADHAEIRVSDNGTGISDAQRVFDPFYTTKPTGQGTGLGLSVCYGIVREHGGEIHASNWKDGALFTVRLPLTDETPQKPKTLPLYEPPAVIVSGVRGLVVDDETHLVKLQIHILSRLGFEVHGVASADEAVEYLENHEVDIVISDARMPGRIDGIELFHWVRTHRPGLADRFVLTTGDLAGLEESLPQELKSRCISKPFTAREYRQVVQRILEKQRT